MSRGNSFLVVLSVLVLALVAAPQARAAITVVNQIGDGLGNAGTIGGAPWLPASPYYTLNQPFTVTGGNVLVVELGDRQNTNATALPTTLTWDGVTLNEDVTVVSKNASYRLVAIYSAPISITGLSNITGSIPDGTDLTGSWMTAFTLSGVDTSKAILTGGTDGTVSPETVTVNGNVVAGSYAAVNYTFGNAGYTVNVAGSSGTATLWTQNTVGASSAAQGYIANLSALSNTFTASETAGTGAGNPYKTPLAVAVFTPQVASGTAWNVSGSGSWNLGSNWSSGLVPSGTGAVAQFGASFPTAAAAVTLDAAITLNSLTFANSNQITIDPGNCGTLTFSRHRTPGVTANYGLAHHFGPGHS